MITGAGGQLGRCLSRRLAGRDVMALGSGDLDITAGAALAGLLRGLGRPPDVLVNAAAFTHVDRCESEPERAWRVNAEAPGVLAEVCKELGVLLVHVSTDYVFDGRARRPYREDDPTHPRSVYGRTKLEGETRVLAASDRFLVVRSSWVFGPGRNFVRTILELAELAERPGAAPLRVVDDQHGSPTYAGDLAEGLVGLVEAGAHGLYHLANRGVASWWDVARAALEVGGKPHVEIQRVTTKEFPRPAERPAWSVLDCTRAERLGVRLRPWREGLVAYLQGPDSPL